MLASASHFPGNLDLNAKETLSLAQFFEPTIGTKTPYGSFRKLGVPYIGVLIIRILPFRILY